MRSLRNRGFIKKPNRKIVFGGVTGQQVILAVFAGQSNMEGGRYDGPPYREAEDIDITNGFQFVGYPSAGNYQQISSDITPLLHPFNFDGIANGLWTIGKESCQWWWFSIRKYDYSV